MAPTLVVFITYGSEIRDHDWQSSWYKILLAASRQVTHTLFYHFSPVFNLDCNTCYMIASNCQNLLNIPNVQKPKMYFTSMNIKWKIHALKIITFSACTFQTLKSHHLLLPKHFFVIIIHNPLFLWAWLFPLHHSSRSWFSKFEPFELFWTTPLSSPQFNTNCPSKMLIAFILIFFLTDLVLISAKFCLAHKMIQYHKVLPLSNLSISNSKWCWNYLSQDFFSRTHDGSLNYKVQTLLSYVLNLLVDFEK